MAVYVRDDQDATNENGTPWLYRDIAVRNRPPTVSYTCDNEAPLSGTTVTCTATAADADGSIAAINWAIYDTAAGGWIYRYGNDPTLTYSWPRIGTGTVAVYVRDDQDATNENGTPWFYRDIAVRNRPPTVSFSCDNEAPLSGTMVTCTATAADADGSISAINWAIYDAAAGGWIYRYGNDPVLTYSWPRAGAGQVAVYVRDNLDATNPEVWIYRTISVQNRPPTARPAFTPNAQPTFTTIQLTANASDPDGSMVSYAWYTLNPAGVWTYIGGAENPTFLADRPGTWYAYLLATDNNGAGVERYTTAITVTNRAPTFSYTCDNLAPLSGTTVTCTATAADADGSISAINWAYYDTSVGAWTYRWNSGATFTYSWPRPGTGTIAAYAVDDLGLANAEGWIYTNIAVLNRPPSASPSFTPDAQPSFTTIQLTANASDPDGSVVSYAWSTINPSGGWTAIGGAANPTFQANVPGAWQAHVVVTDDQGASVGAYTGTITVTNRAPTVSFICDNEAPLSQTTVTCTATASDADGNIAAYNWAIYDAAVGGWIYRWNSGAQTSYSWPQSGTAQVALYVTDNLGAQNPEGWIYRTINVQNRPPTAAPSFTPDGQPVGTTIQLYANASDPDGSVVSYAWSTLNPAGVWTSLGGAENPTFQANSPGIWYAYLLATDNNGAGVERYTSAITVVDLRAPGISGPGGQSWTAIGEQRGFSYGLYNPNAVSRTYCLRISSDNNAVVGSVGGDGADACGITVGAGQTYWFGPHYLVANGAGNSTETALVYD
ncbi:MAG: hypothetical protein M3418_02645, partial [Gemmatimonadota bacterium]|nr:hypothetical protein [Gemmatimonadota bacterium]